MVDIASASNISNQVPIDRNSSQENVAETKEAVSKTAEDSTIERKEVEADTGPNLGKKVDIRA